jgi:DNA modification methylase
MRSLARTAAPVAHDFVVGDCRDILRTFPDDHFSACITDPPYNYEFVGRNWDDQEIRRRLERVRESKTLVKNLPYGSGLAGGVRNARWYEAIRRNINEYRTWCESWAIALHRTLRPGAYCLVFNSTRTVAHVQVALESAGFYARDILVYRRHAGIPKGLNVAQKLKSQGRKDWESWTGWHSCLRNEWEAICVVQKPLVENYLRTLEHSGVGLLRAQVGADGPFRSNILEGFRKDVEDQTVDGHCTIKPLSLIRNLVDLVVPSIGPHIVVDPFAGTGTTCLAAQALGHGFVGIEINEDYAQIARKRLSRSNEKLPADPSLSGNGARSARHPNVAQELLFDEEQLFPAQRLKSALHPSRTTPNRER